jgi:hypothetical protein
MISLLVILPAVRAATVVPRAAADEAGKDFEGRDKEFDISAVRWPD